MSELKLSVPLIRSIQKLLEEEDPEARDGLVAAQYLAAVMGFLVGSHEMSVEDRKETMDELSEFGRYVMQDIESQSKPAPAPAQEATGVWRPGDP
jgi:hypothetical protein